MAQITYTLYNLLLVYLMVLIFCVLSHPFFKSIGLFFICITLLFYIVSFGGWFNYVLCFIYLGGILILFLYVTSILPAWRLPLSQLTSSIITYTLTILIIFKLPINLHHQATLQVETNFPVMFYSFVILKLLIVIFILMLISLVVSSSVVKKIRYPVRLILGFKLNKLLIFKIKNAHLKLILLI